jgi:hypothetical protein
LPLSVPSSAACRLALRRPCPHQGGDRERGAVH